ncbi:MAG: type IV secretion system DNA-binding domain-containing protein [Candidatus Nitrosotalea sp.]|nr:type IV secretion system DNA-binding domain-containing protein [Candidatus Nitrosotalea sp.]
MSSGKSDITVLGFNDNGLTAGIPRNEQIHTGIFGEVGSGKSIVDTIMINQNINRDEGFMLVDPHGTLAQDVLRMIPESKKDRVIYISLDTVRLWGKIVKINPLEVKSGGDRYVVAMNLVNALRNIYHDSWGPQLEALLRNGTNALVEIEDSTLRDLVKIITDERMRSIFINKVTNRDVRHFWNVLFPQQYQKDAGRSAYNKLDKILSTPQVAAILDTAKSTIDFGDIMESDKWVIVDLSSGGSDDVISFLGTILINMVYVEARKRFGRPVGMTKPFFMYIDEAHLFAPFALRELLNTMRKANMKVTIATQTINTFPREFAKEISALVRTLVCFKVDLETANMFKTVMPVSVEQLTSMTQGRFAFYSQGNPPHTGLLIAVPIVDRKKDWKELARYSVEKYGESTSLERYVMPTKSQHPSPQVTPLEATILLLLYNENRDMTKDEIYEFIYKMFPVDKRDVFSKLDDILVNQLRLVERKNMIFYDGADKLAISYVLSGLAYNSFFSQTAIGRRAGSPLHQTTIFLIMNMQQKTFKFCIPDLGDKGEQRPDLLIFEPQRRKASKGITCDPLHWSEKIIAVEVEIDPTKHESQVVENFRKNFELGYDVWFIVFSDKYKQYVVDTMNKNNIAKQFYNIAIISPDAVGRLGNIQNNSISCLTGEELEVYNVLKSNGTAQSVDYKTGLSACDVMKILWKLEQKGVTERGYVETGNIEFDLERKDIAQVKRPEYLVPVEEGKKLGENSDSHNLETEKKNDTAASSDANVQQLAGFDFSKLSNQGLKDLVLDPECGTFAKTLLENRGNYVYVKNGKVKTRKKSR